MERRKRVIYRQTWEQPSTVTEWPFILSAVDYDRELEFNFTSVYMITSFELYIKENKVITLDDYDWRVLKGMNQAFPLYEQKAGVKLFCLVIYVGGHGMRMVRVDEYYLVEPAPVLIKAPYSVTLLQGSIGELYLQASGGCPPYTYGGGKTLAQAKAEVSANGKVTYWIDEGVTLFDFPVGVQDAQGHYNVTKILVYGTKKEEEEKSSLPVDEPVEEVKEAVTSDILEGLEKVSTSIGEVVKATTGIITESQKMLSSSVEKISETVAGYIGATVDWVGEKVSGIKEAVEESLGDFAEEIYGSVRGWINAISESITRSIDKISGVISSISQSVYNSVENLAKRIDMSLKTAISNIGNVLKKVFEDIGKSLINYLLKFFFEGVEK